MAIAASSLSRSTNSTAYKTSPKCQSCGVPMVYDSNGGGTCLDGTLSRDYCGSCFRDGRFVDPNITLRQMRSRTYERLVAVGYPGLAARLMTLGLRRLARWRAVSLEKCAMEILSVLFDEDLAGKSGTTLAEALEKATARRGFEVTEDVKASVGTYLCGNGLAVERSDEGIRTLRITMAGIFAVNAARSSRDHRGVNDVLSRLLSNVL